MSEPMDVKYDSEKVKADAEAFIEAFKSRITDLADEIMGKAYSDILPYIETDAWTNYREALRIELEHEYKYSTFKSEWAVNFRRAVFVENREEISKLIEQDILKRIKHLEDCKQEFEMFRYTPLGDTYQDLKADNTKLKARVERYELALEKMANHVPRKGADIIEKAVCEAYAKEARDALDFETKQSEGGLDEKNS